MGYVTQFTPGGRRDLTKVALPEATRILRRLAELQRAMDEGDISAFDVKSLRGYPSHWRLRVGDHRVVYTIEDGMLVIWVVAVGNRREVYRRF